MLGIMLARQFLRDDEHFQPDNLEPPVFQTGK